MNILYVNKRHNCKVTNFHKHLLKRYHFLIVIGLSRWLLLPQHFLITLQDLTLKIQEKCPAIYICILDRMLDNNILHETSVIFYRCSHDKSRWGLINFWHQESLGKLKYCGLADITNLVI